MSDPQSQALAAAATSQQQSPPAVAGSHAGHPPKLRAPGEQHSSKAASVGLLRHSLPGVPLSPAAQPGHKHKRSTAGAVMRRQPSGSCSSADTTDGSDTGEGPMRHLVSNENLPAGSAAAAAAAGSPAASPRLTALQAVPAAAPTGATSAAKTRPRRASVTEILAESESSLLMAELNKLKTKSTTGAQMQADAAAAAPSLSLLPSPTKPGAPAGAGQKSQGRSLGAALMSAMGVPHLPAIDHHHHHHHAAGAGSVSGSGTGSGTGAGGDPHSPSAVRSAPAHGDDSVFAPSPSMQRPSPFQQQKGSFHLPPAINVGSMRCDSETTLPDSPLSPLSPSIGKDHHLSRLGKGSHDGVEPGGKSIKSRRSGAAGSGLIAGYYKGTNEASALDYRSLERLPDGVRQALQSHRHRSESGVYRSVDGQPDSLTAAVQAATQGQARTGGEPPLLTAAPPELASLKVDTALSSPHSPHRMPPARLDAATLATLPRLPQLTGGGKA